VDRRLRAALYLRISKDDARTGLAVERQRDECMAIIKRHRFELVESYRDNGVSAYDRKTKRPEYDRMTRDYAAGKFDVIVCWDLDRFTRQPAQLEHWIELGEARGLKILSVTEEMDLGTDNGRMYARIKASVARAEIERKSERQRAQVAQAKAMGTFRSGKQAFSDEAVIKSMYRDVLDGIGVYRIAARLNEEGLTTIRGNTWSGTAVRGVIRAERNLKFVDRDDWESAVAFVQRGMKVGPKERGLYSGVARCVCKRALTASGEHYVCSFATNHPGSTGHVSIKRTTLEPLITNAMIEAFMYSQDSVNPVQDVLADIDREIALVADKKQQFLDLLAADLVTDKEAATQLRALKKRGDDLERRRLDLVAENAQAAMVDGLRREFLSPRKSKQLGADDETAFERGAKVKRELLARWQSFDIDKRRSLAKDFLDVRLLPKTESPRVRVRHMVVTSLNEQEIGSFFG